MCRAKSEGLVRYPTTLAPVSGAVTVTTQCADNAHGLSSSLNVLCTSSGSWSGELLSVSVTLGIARKLSVEDRFVKVSRQTVCSLCNLTYQLQKVKSVSEHTLAK